MSKFDTPLNVLDTEVYRAWLAKIQSHDLANGDSAVKDLVSALYNNESCSVTQRLSGSYNFCFQIRFHSGQRPDMLLRFPIHGAVMNPRQKVEDEAAVMRFIRAETSIPIPRYLAHGIAAGKFAGLGPFILMEFVAGQRLDEMLCVGDEFKPSITEGQLKRVYGQIASMYVQLWRLDFDRVGRLAWNDDGATPQWCVKPGPLTIKQNELECYGITVPEIQTPPDNASAYITQLINQTLLTLRHNSTILTPDDSRTAYRSLAALRAITPHMTSSTFAHGPFKLYNPDIRLGNMIASADLEIRAFIDWDFCCVAPAQFLYSPPLGLTPLDMLACSDGELAAFTVQLDRFVAVLQEQDEALAGLMEECMRDGTFWFNQAVQESVFWEGMVERLWVVRGRPEVEDPADTEEFVRLKAEQYREKWKALT